MGRAKKEKTMNKRIKELAIEAGMYVDLDGKPYPKRMAAEGCEVAYKKFAELIVRECCDLVREIDAMEIRKHFGVE